MKRDIKFIVNETLIETNISQGTVLLDFLREEQGVMGTKEVCREGDCGACSVLLGEIHGDIVTYKTVPSCLTPVGDLQGKHIVTIEGINKTDGLTPIQTEFVNEHASQCGFCTPGFIISLTNFYLNSKELSYTDAVDYMDGNICRCTGYMSIKRAAKNLLEKHSKSLNNKKDRIEQLVNWGILPEYFKNIYSRLKEISDPDTVHEKGKTVISGGTDLFVQRADSLLDEELEFIGHNRRLTYIKEDKGKIAIGGETTITELRDSPVINKYLSSFKEDTDLIASTIIRNRASVTGNIVNASPIGDLSIILLALNAELFIKSSKIKARRDLLKDFYSGYKQTDLKKDEFINKICFKIPDPNFKFSFEKVSKRKHLDIASVNSAMGITTNGKIIENINLSGGGVWAYPLYLNKTSEFLVGKEINPVVLQDAAEILLSEIAPIDDVRGSAEYKKILLRQLFYTHFIKLFGKYIKMEELL